MTVAATRLRELPIVDYPKDHRFMGADGRSRPVRAVLAGGRAELPSTERIVENLWNDYGILIVEHWATDKDVLRSRIKPELVVLIRDVIGHTMMELSCRRGPSIKGNSKWALMQMALEKVGWKKLQRPPEVPAFNPPVFHVEHSQHSQHIEPKAEEKPVNRIPVAATAPVSRQPAKVVVPQPQPKPTPYKAIAPTSLSMRDWVSPVLSVLLNSKEPLSVLAITDAFGLTDESSKSQRRTAIYSAITELQRTHHITAHDTNGYRGAARWRVNTKAEREELIRKYGPRVARLASITGHKPRQGGRVLGHTAEWVLSFFLDGKEHNKYELAKAAKLSPERVARCIGSLMRTERVVSGPNGKRGSRNNATYILNPSYDPAQDGLERKAPKVEAPKAETRPIHVEGEEAGRSTTRPAVAAEAGHPSPSDLKAAAELFRDACIAAGCDATLTVTGNKVEVKTRKVVTIVQEDAFSLDGE